MNARRIPITRRDGAALVLTIAAAACGGDPLGGEGPARAVSERTHEAAPPAWLDPTAACPEPSSAPLQIPPVDRWSGLVQFKDASDTLFLAPIHVSVTIDGELMMMGFSRTTGDFSPLTLDVSPTFLMKPDLHTEAPTTARAEIYGVPYDGSSDSFICGGHTFLDDGRLMTVGGTRIAKFAQSPLGNREFGLHYGAIFGPTGWVRIPRDFIGGESWYPTVLRLSDGRIIQYSGYFELDAPLANARITYNRTLQFFDPKNPVDPWTMISPTPSTPEGTQPVNYTWMYELTPPVVAAGRERQLFMMGSGGATYLVNIAESFADPAARFVARTPRPTSARPPDPPELKSAFASTAMLMPFFHEAEKRWYRPGSVLLVGGGEQPSTQAQTDVYDPSIDKWCSLTRPLEVRRRNSVGIHLPDGNILVINGEPLPPTDPNRPQLAPLIIDPRTGATATGKKEDLSSTRGYHNVATLLPDGRVFVGGGRTYRVVDQPDERSDGRFYSPYYLGVLPPSDRPRVTGIPRDPVMHYDAEYAVDFIHGPIDGAALIALGSVTHATDFNARYVELSVERGNGPRGQLTLRGPRDGRIAPPGHYMLFLLRDVGGVKVPSVAQIIRVGGPNPSCEGAPVNGCGGCRTLLHPPGTTCHDVCGAGTFKCDGPNETSCNACL